jgi:dihydroneopterin aldolase
MNKSPFTPSDLRLSAAKTFVQDIRVEAEIGLYPHEYGRTQPLIVDVELDVAPSGFEDVGDVVNYENILAWTREVAASGHIELVETFAHRVAQACMKDARVIQARVRVRKPEALAPAVAGVEITLKRGTAV